ncbi:MAG TPA: sugar phosphate isomerase/epimerase family protein [Nitrososphaera sp.]|nr:sugar phosphate isomerase/epimerase family protein [Nitrososphaera sp.]
MKKQQLAFSTNAFKRYLLEDSVREIAKVGYSGVEILCDVPHAYPPNFGACQVESLKRTLASFGLQISNLNAFTLYAIGDVYRPSWIEDDGHARDLRIRHTIDCIRIAKELGAKHLSTEPGGPVAAPSHPAYSHKLEIFLESLAKAAVVAEEQDVRLLVEPEPGLLIENSRQFKYFMEKIDSNYIGLNFDIGHFYCVNEEPAKLVYELSGYISHFHLADIASNRVHNHLIPGTGSIDFRPIFDAMDDIGYEEFVTVELYPYQDNPVQAAREAYDYLCKIM